MKKIAIALAATAALGGMTGAQAALVEVTPTAAFSGGTAGGIIGAGTFILDTDTGVISGGDLAVGFNVAGPPPAGFGNLFNWDIDGAVLGGGAAANADFYQCIDGPFGAIVGASICGNYNFGGDFGNGVNDSTLTYGPGTTVTRVIGGDDIPFGPPQSISDNDNLVTTGFAGLGSVVLLDNRVLVDDGEGGMELSGIAYEFTVVPVPAAAWLFGSALGLLGFVRRRMTA